MPEIDWLLFLGVLFAFILLCGIGGTFLAGRERKAEEERRRKAEKFTPTHRRTREK